MGSPSVSSGQPRSAFAHGRAEAVPLFHAAWLFAVGIFLAHLHWLPAPFLFVPTLLMAGITVVALLRAPRLLLLPLALLWMLVGAWCAEMQPQPAPAPELVSLSDGLLRTVEGTVVRAGALRTETDEDVQQGAATLSSERVDLRLSSIEHVSDTEDRQAPIDGAIRLTVRWPQGATPQRIDCGQRIRAVVRLLPPQVYRDPGAWSRADYLLDQGITTSATVSADRVSYLQPAGSRWPCLFSDAQQAASARLLQLPSRMQSFPAWLRLSSDDAIMLSAMLTGDRTFLSHSLRAGFERTGSFHMLVVSGLHLAIVAGLVLLLARKLRIPNVPTTLVTIAASLAYALFTGFAAPVQRSLWMVSLYLIGRLFYRGRNPLNLIGFAALCLLVASPRSLFQASFQMTLLAVLAIAGIAAPLLRATIEPYLKATRDLPLIAIDPKLEPPVAQFRVLLRMFARRLQAVTNRKVAWIAAPGLVRIALRCVEALVVAIIVELAMTLPMAIYFHRLTLLALPVNLFILPLLLLLMPMALLTLLVLLASPAAAAFPAALTALLLHFGTALVQRAGALRWSDLRLPSPSSTQAAVFMLLIVLAMALVRMQGRAARGLAWLSLVCSALAAVAPYPLQHPRNALLVEAIDVGQGDSLLLITPEGKTLLIDAGGFGGGPRATPQDFDIGEEVVSPALWSRGIRHLDVVALTHGHSDHMGGMPAVLRNFHPDELWVGKNPPSPGYLALLSQATQQKMRVRHFIAGDHATLGSAQVRVLAPTAAYKPGADPSNDDSLVLRVTYGGTSVLLEGDAEAPVEQAMEGETGLQSQLLKIGHHGSTTSTQPAFLARVAPQWAVISCGLRNRYGHPRIEVLDRLQTAGVRTASTDAQGASCFQLDGKAVRHEISCTTDQLR